MPGPECQSHIDQYNANVPIDQLTNRERRIKQIVEQKETQLQREGKILFERILSLPKE